jgi:hypothetical protein
VNTIVFRRDLSRVFRETYLMSTTTTETLFPHPRFPIFGQNMKFSSTCPTFVMTDVSKASYLLSNFALHTIHLSLTCAVAGLIPDTSQLKPTLPTAVIETFRSVPIGHQADCTTMRSFVWSASKCWGGKTY